MNPQPETGGVDEFVDRVRRERLAAGQPEFITDPAVYNILDGIMAERETASTDPDIRADRRRRAVQRSRDRVPDP